MYKLYAREIFVIENLVNRLSFMCQNVKRIMYIGLEVFF